MGNHLIFIGVVLMFFACVYERTENVSGNRPYRAVIKVKDTTTGEIVQTTEITLFPERMHYYNQADKNQTYLLEVTSLEVLPLEKE